MRSLPASVKRPKHVYHTIWRKAKEGDNTISSVFDLDGKCVLFLRNIVERGFRDRSHSSAQASCQHPHKTDSTRPHPHRREASRFSDGRRPHAWSLPLHPRLHGSHELFPQVHAVWFAFLVFIRIGELRQWAAHRDGPATAHRQPCPPLGGLQPTLISHACVLLLPSSRKAWATPLAMWMFAQPVELMSQRLHSRRITHAQEAPRIYTGAPQPPPTRNTSGTNWQVRSLISGATLISTRVTQPVPYLDPTFNEVRSSSQSAIPKGSASSSLGQADTVEPPEKPAPQACLHCVSDLLQRRLNSQLCPEGMAVNLSSFSWRNGSPKDSPRPPPSVLVHRGGTGSFLFCVATVRALSRLRTPSLTMEDPLEAPSTTSSVMESSRPLPLATGGTTWSSWLPDFFHHRLRMVTTSPAENTWCSCPGAPT